MTHHINLHPQITDWSSPTTTGANGFITAVLCERGLPAWSVSDEVVVSPNPITQAIKSGGLENDHHVYLPATTGAQYWKFTITLGDVYRTWYFTWDDVAHTDFGDLNFIDPYDYEGAP
jgi:hypothetical protein